MKFSYCFSSTEIYIISAESGDEKWISVYEREGDPDWRQLGREMRYLADDWREYSQVCFYRRQSHFFMRFDFWKSFKRVSIDDMINVVQCAKIFFM